MVLNPRYNDLKTETKQIMSRLLASLPAASFEMETFARLAGAVATRKVPTAAMECRHRPRLLMNPDFVAKYCERDEHLFLLVMHELWHVMLAHTSLYPRVTKAHNIAFDAVINAGLMAQFNKPAFRGFFERLNPPDKFPHLLLRPPVGWPNNPQYPDVGPSGTKRVLQQLYPPGYGQQRAMPFYDEILDLIRQDMREKGIDPDGVVLLGDHDPAHSKRNYGNTYLKDAMGRIVAKWPLKPGQFGAPGQGGRMNDWQVDALTSAHETRRVFSGVLRKTLGRTSGQLRRKERLPIAGITGTSVLPNPRDRLMPAKKRLGAPGTLWALPGQIKARIPDNRVKAHVYLDVSGSMSGVLPYLLNLILPYVANDQAEIFQFSTRVDTLNLHNLKQGILRTSGGTNIYCVMEHILKYDSHLKRVLMVTDGYTGRPSLAHLAQIQENGTYIHTVLPAQSPYRDDLAELSSAMTVLPPLA